MWGIFRRRLSVPHNIVMDWIMLRLLRGLQIMHIRVILWVNETLCWGLVSYDLLFIVMHRTSQQIMLSKPRCWCEQLGIRLGWHPQLFHVRKLTENWCDQDMSLSLNKQKHNVQTSKLHPTHPPNLSQTWKVLYKMRMRYNLLPTKSLVELDDKCYRVQERFPKLHHVGVIDHYSQSIDFITNFQLKLHNVRITREEASKTIHAYKGILRNPRWTHKTRMTSLLD